MHDDEALRSFGLSLARAEQEKLSALALVGTGKANIRDWALPHIIYEASRRAGGDLEHIRTAFFQIEPGHQVRRRRVPRKKTMDGRDGVHPDEVAIGRAGRGHQHMLDFAKGNEWHRPQVNLTRALKVSLVIKLLDGLLGRITVVEVVRELQLADAGLDGLRLGLCADGGECQHANECSCEENLFVSSFHCCVLSAQASATAMNKCLCVFLNVLYLLVERRRRLSIWD